MCEENSGGLHLYKQGYRFVLVPGELTSAILRVRGD